MLKIPARTKSEQTRLKLAPFCGERAERCIWQRALNIAAPKAIKPWLRPRMTI